MASLKTAEVCQLLKNNGFDDEVVESLRINKIDGATLLDLSSKDLKELGIIALGDRKRLEKMCKSYDPPKLIGTGRETYKV